MNSSKAYEKLINKIQHNLIDLEKKIDTHPDVNILNLPLIIFKSFSFSSQIKELDDELNQLRGKVKSALDTYVKTVYRQKNIEIQTNIENEASINQGYLSKLMRLLEKIALLEDKLRRKSLQNFLDNTTEKNSEKKIRNISMDDIDWEELDLYL